MYGISIQKPGGCVFLRSAEIARMVGEREYSAEQMKHLAAIERLEARGTSYCNQDFDVLSAAHSFALTTNNPIPVHASGEFCLWPNDKAHF